MKKKVLFFAIGLACLQPLTAQYSQGQVLLAAGGSSVPFAGYSLIKGIEGYGQGLEAVLPVLEPLPLFQIDPAQGGLWTLGGVATFATAELSTVTATPKSLQHTLFLVNAKYGMFTTYQVYQEFRSRSDADYRDFKKYSFSEVTLAPFLWESYANPVSLTTIPLMLLGEGISKVLESGTSRSIFVTGKTYIDGTEYTPWVGVPLRLTNAAMVAVQNSYEEAYWRGFVYEELKHDFKGNWILASVVNNALFALWHIPTQGWNWSIAGVFASGALCTWAYELGGVPAAGAAHGIVNAFSDLIDFALYDGTASPS